MNESFALNICSWYHACCTGTYLCHYGKGPQKCRPCTSSKGTWIYIAP